MPENNNALDPAVVEQARALMDSGERRLLGVVGAPGCGKSTFVDALVAALGPAAQVLPMDGYHLANTTLRSLGRADRKGAPDTFDAFGYLALLQRLHGQRPDETVYAPGFYREIEEPIAGSIGVDPDVRLVVTEGNYLLLEDTPWNEVSGVLDETWYLEVDQALRLKRLVARHVQFGRSQSEAEEWVARVDEANAERIAAGRHRASRILNWAGDDDGRFVL